MTPERYLEIEETLAAAGFTYDIGIGDFITGDGRVAEWEELTTAMPGLTNLEWVEYSDRRDGE
jgi:hypothetical protein